uniref:Uncharacterized protein n=1 Tax=Zosterops lateralis melanops TaxID=1220523 RepID=A0A8D2PFR8_ZOSLA
EKPVSETSQAKYQMDTAKRDMICTTCKCLGQMSREAYHDPLVISESTSRFCNQLVTRADFGLFPPVLNPLALPAFKTPHCLCVCTSLCTLKPEDEKEDVAWGFQGIG